MKFYEVGGCVRDEILGVNSKDIDYTVVLEDYEIAEIKHPRQGSVKETYFDFMVRMLEQKGFKIFVQSPEFLTARAQFPKDTKRGNLTADFVLARKEGDYSDGRRPDVVEPGTLHDDLARRDFTMNAIAKDLHGNYVDPFFGRAAIKGRLIVAVGNPVFRIREDALRAVRALRFAVTKGFTIESSLQDVLRSRHVAEALTHISDERIQQELSKMFRYDSVASMRILNEYPALTDAMFAGRVNLDATLKTKGRGK